MKSGQEPEGGEIVVLCAGGLEEAGGDGDDEEDEGGPGDLGAGPAEGDVACEPCGCGHGGPLEEVVEAVGAGEEMEVEDGVFGEGRVPELSENVGGVVSEVCVLNPVHDSGEAVGQRVPGVDG